MGGNDSFSVDSHLRRAARAAFWATIFAIASHIAMDIVYWLVLIVGAVLDDWSWSPSVRYTWPIGRALLVAAALCWLLCAVNVSRAIPRTAGIRWLSWFVVLLAFAAVLWRVGALAETCLILTDSPLPAGAGKNLSRLASVAGWMRPIFAIAIGLLLYVALRVEQRRLAWLRWRVAALVITGVGVWVLGYVTSLWMESLPTEVEQDVERGLWLSLFGVTLPLLAWRLWLAYVALRTWRWREKPTATGDEQAI